jgi:hypothetical protein
MCLLLASLLRSEKKIWQTLRIAITLQCQTQTVTPSNFIDYATFLLSYRLYLYCFV